MCDTKILCADNGLIHRGLWLMVTLSVCMLLTACSDGGGNKPSGNTAFLNVSVTDFYFGTRDVGTTATQTIELANQSADIYPVRKLVINGENSEEFETNFAGGITLNPSEKIAVNLSFSPLSDGPKTAVLDIDYDIIEQATEAQNQLEQEYYTAKALEDQDNYSASKVKYQNYVNASPVTINKQRAVIKLPVLAEAEQHGDGRDFDQYLQAVNHREDGETRAAVRVLDSLLENTTNSYLADDALYLKGYIQLLDEKDYVAARKSMTTLTEQHPDSTYYDTALYSIALSLEESGDSATARVKYLELISRHRSEAWAALKLNIAKDNYFSRLWFARANDGLDRLPA